MPPVLLEAKLHTVGKEDPLHFTIRAVSMSIVPDQMSVDQTPRYLHNCVQQALQCQWYGIIYWFVYRTNFSEII